jgi:VanZ family protein
MALKRIIKSSPAYLYTVIVVLAVLYLTLVPKPLPDNDLKLFEGADKVVHAIMFFGVMICMAFDYTRKRSHVSATPLIGFCIIAIAFGGAIEYIQDWMGLGRSKDIYDFVADSIGAVIALVVSLISRRKFIQWLQQEQ